MELQTHDAVAVGKSLMRATGARRNARCFRRQTKCVAVPMENGEFLQCAEKELLGAVVQLDGQPADFLFHVLIDLRAENVSNQLRTEANPEHCFSGADSFINKKLFLAQPRMKSMFSIGGKTSPR